MVYLHPFCRNLLFCSRKLQIKITSSRLFKVIDIDTTKKHINRVCYDKQHVCAYLQAFYARQANSEKITTLTPACACLVEHRGSRLGLLRSTCKQFLMQVVLVHLQPFRRNLLTKCVSQPEITKNSLKLSILGVQGRLKSLTLTPLKDRRQRLL